MGFVLLFAVDHAGFDVTVVVSGNDDGHSALLVGFIAYIC